jgi:hypothetical protein
LVETNNARIANLMVTSKPEATALLTALVHSVVENRKVDWYLASGNTLWVNSVDAVAQARLIDPSLRVTEATMIRSLRAMSTGRRQTQRVKNKQLKKMWELHPDVLESWCDATNIVDYDDVVEAIKAAEVAAAVAAAAEAKGQQNGRAD